MKSNYLHVVLGMLAVGLGLLGCNAPSSKARLALYDLSDNSSLNSGQALMRLKNASIILVGEHHTNADHHKLQLAVIETLVQAGEGVAIGLEMFRKENQSYLDQWIAGELSEEAFSKIYFKEWNFPWSLYRDIFIYAREHGIAMIGLNVAEGITRQVAYHGFGSLSNRQKMQIGNITCDVTPQYRQFIQNALGAHAHGNLNFNNFCEAQLIWDTVMAENALAYHNAHPQKKMIILAGTGHARKMGIPTQIKKRFGPPVLVILPETTDSITFKNTDIEAADYLFRDK